MQSLVYSRRAALQFTAASACGAAMSACAQVPATLPVAIVAPVTSAPQSVSDAMARFAAKFPSSTAASGLVRVDSPRQTWKSGYHADQQMFVGSAIKTFILAQFLRDVETGRNGLKLGDLCTVSDAERSLSSPVLIGMNGKMPYRMALEAMIAHSDNTATDIAMAKAEPARVRALIAEAGLKQTQIPDSTRRMVSYLSGANYGVDLGWDGMQRLTKGETLGLTSRINVINPQESMLSSTTELASWYHQALGGKFFSQPSTLTEFKRVSSMATGLWGIVPSDAVAYGKGGSIDWGDFNCMCIAGQMRINTVPASFAFTLNWTGPERAADRAQALGAAISDIFNEVVKAVQT